MAGESILERKPGMVPWIFCFDNRIERGTDHQIRQMAGKPGFRSSEACSVKKCHGLARGYLQIEISKLLIRLLADIL